MKKMCFALFCFLFVTTAGFSQEKLVVAGAGPSTNVVDLFFRNFSQQTAAQGYTFFVPPESIKHAGGIKHSFKNLFGRTGRPLNDQELLHNRDQIFLAMMPISFATGHDVAIEELSMRELEMIFRKKITNWKTVGGPDAEIITVGRENTEALFSELKRDYKFFNQATFDVVFDKDHEVIDFLNSPKGSYAISFGAKANLDFLHQIFITEDLRSGVRVGLVYDRGNKDLPLVKAVQAYAQSDEWRSVVKQNGAYPIR